MKKFSTLNAAEQLVLRKIIRKGSIENLSRNYDLIAKFEKLKKKRYRLHDSAYRAIKRVATKLVKGKVLKCERVTLSVITINKVINISVYRYVINQYWLRENRENVRNLKLGNAFK